MKELIFSIRNIFEARIPHGCLTQYNADTYYIPAYQRGYKWGSSENGAVTILLDDLKKAYQRHKISDRKEYYLQYITVKPVKIDGSNVLEVIDGQQRLTTLSILLSAISSITETENVAENKLSYAIRSNFFNTHIYDGLSFLNLIALDWSQLIVTEAATDSQDVYYLFTAAKKCYVELSDYEEIHDFKAYLLEHVKLIVNSVESHVDSETVFRNLNSNKVPLTETELIKGLLITKIGRMKSGLLKLRFQEINEIRSNVGRKWDEILNWSNTDVIRSFYFNNQKDGMYHLLHLVALSNDLAEAKNATVTNKDYPLFNAYLTHYDVDQLYKSLIRIYYRLNDWFLDSTIYNLLGYNRYVKNSPFNKPGYLVELLKLDSTSGLIGKLKGDKNGLISSFEINSINYQDNPDSVHHVLLSMNVFSENEARFDFFNYERHEWTLEHIFPRTPEGKGKVLNESDKIAIIDILGSSITQEVIDVLNLPMRNDDQKEIYYKALHEHPTLNSIGNMCLLTRSDNASNGNKFFHEKRANILNLIRNNSFVPKHTFDVFSKMFEGADSTQMTNWTLQDKNAHSNYIVRKMELTKL